MKQQMTSGRWQRIKEVFCGARERSGLDRENFLERECGEDVDLLSEVRGLLAADDAGGPIDDLEKKIAAALQARSAENAEDRRVGAYEVLHKVGEGGMGRVYQARRADGQFDQLVALKILPAELSSRERVERFLAERQILASLSHPNIARLLDGGVTPDGRPFFAMECVEGQPLDEYCDDNTLPIERRLELFLSVCDAVQYAHSALVVHRDLKPSNILVSESGDVKLLDFGVAKLLDAETPPDHLAVQTRTGYLPLTPAYASPEQVRGNLVTTGTDVYQLGVVLYELLTGRRPFDVAGRTPSEVEQIICDEQPVRPSAVVIRDADVPAAERCACDRATAPNLLRSRLRGDLDNIILKALRKEPEARYRSVEQLAEDIRRHLDGRPISGRPQTRAYRTARFIRRHQWGVSTAAVIAVMIIGYAATITWHSQRTQAALAEAELEARRSEQVTGFMMQLFEASDPAQSAGETLTARQLLERGIERTELLRDEPEIQAQMLDVVGQAYSRLGDYARAMSLLEEALEIRREVLGDHHRYTAATRVHLGTALQLSGRYADAIPLFQEALEIQQDLLGDDHPDVASTMSALGGVLRVEGDLDEAEASLREALAIQREASAENHADMGETLNILGLLLMDRQEPTEAEDAMREAVEIRRRLLGDAHPQLAMSLNNLAMLLRKQGDLEEAEPVYREALEVKRRLYGDAHPSIASTLDGLGLLLMDRGDLPAAQRHLTEALEMRRATLGADHPLVAGSLNNLGNLLEEMGRLDEAAEHLAESRSRLLTALGDGHPFVAIPSVGLGRVHMKRNRPDVAEPLLREALAIRESALAEGHPEVLEVRSMLGECLSKLNRYDEAESLLVRVAEDLAPGADNGDLERETARRLVALYEEWDRLEDADRYAAVLKTMPSGR